MKKKSFASKLSKLMAIPTEQELQVYFLQQSIKRAISLKDKLGKKK